MTNNYLPSRQVMAFRMALYQKLRTFFQLHNISEVETPILSSSGTTDLHIDSFLTQKEKEEIFYLHTSPEFYMKRLLVADFGDCYQLCKVFRNEPNGRHHRSEFTMLEWYRIGFSMEQLIQEMVLLLKSIHPLWKSLKVAQLTYQQAFDNIGIHVFSDSLAIIQQKTIKLCGYKPNLLDDKDEWLDFLMVDQIEPQLGIGELTFLTDYPHTMAALANIKTNEAGHLIAKRFELYYKGIELANGFEELTDAKEQQQRFIADNLAREKNNKATVPYDKQLIDALSLGLPNCSGVALGLDRLIMLFLDKEHLDEVMF